MRTNDLNSHKTRPLKTHERTKGTQTRRHKTRRDTHAQNTQEATRSRENSNMCQLLPRGDARVGSVRTDRQQSAACDIRAMREGSAENDENNKYNKHKKQHTDIQKERQKESNPGTCPGGSLRSKCRPVTGRYQWMARRAQQGTKCRNSNESQLGPKGAPANAHPPAGPPGPAGNA